MSLQLDPLGLMAAKLQLLELTHEHAEVLAALSFAEAIGWLETHLPEMRDAGLLLTWATAAEQLAAELTPEQVLWQQALQTEAYTLRLRARALPTPFNTYTP